MAEYLLFPVVQKTSTLDTPGQRFSTQRLKTALDDVAAGTFTCQQYTSFGCCCKLSPPLLVVQGTCLLSAFLECTTCVALNICTSVVLRLKYYIIDWRGLTTADASPSSTDSRRSSTYSLRSNHGAAAGTGRHTPQAAVRARAHTPQSSLSKLRKWTRRTPRRVTPSKNTSRYNLSSSDENDVVRDAQLISCFHLLALAAYSTTRTSCNNVEM